MLELCLNTATVSVSISFGTALAIYSPTAIAGDLSLEWHASPSSNVGGYRVYYGLSPGSYSNPPDDVGDTTTYILSGLVSGQTYFIAVTAYDDVTGTLESVFSNEVSGIAVISSDSDGDGIIDTNDNCPSVANPSQTDTDGDGQGDACDADDDNDGVQDTADAFPLDAAESVDTDGDGMGDVFENRFGLNPDDPNDAGLDGDADGSTNLEEFRAGMNPNVNETGVIQIINVILLE